ncbi:cation:proton antiporter [Acidobacteriota bacterium]
MGLFNTFAILITITALLSYINHRLIRLPTTIGLMLIAMVISLAMIGLGQLGFGIEKQAEQMLGAIDFNKVLMEGLLSFLLFAGALHVDLNELLDRRWVVSILATFGVLGSTFIVGTLMYFFLMALGIGISYIYCLLFGALISPTDPIAVIGILKSAKVPKRLEAAIAGEALFNDGVGVVVFTVILHIAMGRGEHGAMPVLKIFAEEALGGIAFGLILGWLAYRLLRTVDNYSVEILLTLALVTGGYALALTIHTSGPLAIVVAGIFIGNHGRRFAMSDDTRQHIDTFWELLDEIFNAMLFVLIGLEVLILSFSFELFLAGLFAIVLVLLARLSCVAAIVTILRSFLAFTPRAIRIITWAGLRGGISIALALSLPIIPGNGRDLIITATYSVVVFSILVQGLTMRRLVRGLGQGKVTDHGSSELAP